MAKNFITYTIAETAKNIDDPTKAPNLRNIALVRTQEFIMNYLLNAEEMQEEDFNVKTSIKIFK